MHISHADDDYLKCSRVDVCFGKASMFDDFYLVQAFSLLPNALLSLRLLINILWPKYPIVGFLSRFSQFSHFKSLTQRLKNY
jgi:hypothetical protein